MRTQRMIDSAPEYYQASAGFYQIQNAIAQELNLIEEAKLDIEKQKRILTATWGLKYWEEKLNIPTILTDSYDIRRSRVLAKWRGVGQFRASLIKSVSEAFSGGAVEVTAYMTNQLEGTLILSSAAAGFTPAGPYELAVSGSGVSLVYTEVDVQPYTDYVFSAKSEGACGIGVFSGDGGASLAPYIYGKMLNRPFNSGPYKKVRLYFRKPTDVTSCRIYDWILAKGTTPRPFEPRKELTIGVTFVGRLGIPPNLDDLKAQIDNIVHAHLEVEYHFIYNTYDVMKATKLTYDQLKATGLTYEELMTTKF